MPKHVRNFWVETAVDGVDKVSGAGPRAADGGLSIALHMRDGRTTPPDVRYIGKLIGTEENGVLTLDFLRPDGAAVRLAEGVR